MASVQYVDVYTPLREGQCIDPSGYGGMHDKTLTYNLCGLDVPLNDRFSWFGGGRGVGGFLRDYEKVSIC